MKRASIAIEPLRAAIAEAAKQEPAQQERDLLYTALRKILDSVNAYLPPGGITKEELIARVIEQIDLSH